MKRSIEDQEERKLQKTEAPKKDNSDQDDEMGEFEDPYGDDFESEEEEIFEAGENGEPDPEDGDEDNAMEAQVTEQTQGVFLPNRSTPLGVNEVMEPDYSTYNMLHSINVKWPCLSFDILPDKLGEERVSYPQTMFVVTGTQAKKPKDNEISILKFSQLSKTLVKDEEDDESDDDLYDADPILESKNIPVTSTTNRIRASPFGAQTGEYLVASMMEDGNAHIWDMTPQFNAFERPTTISKQQQKPTFTIKAHGTEEGYAIDWSPLNRTGSLLTGDAAGKVFLTQRTTSGWVTEKQPFIASKVGSIEELQWSPAQQTVFASAGSDGFIRIWDTRQSKTKAAISVKASGTDVNVMSWNHKASHLLASGHDDGVWGVWDLRTFTKGDPVASFSFHKAAITSIEFNPAEESVVAVGSEDNTVTLWDLAVEADDEEIQQQHKEAKGELNDIPSQMLFMHWQPEVKEVHWAKQIPGTLASTGSEGFSLWNTISI